MFRAGDIPVAGYRLEERVGHGTYGHVWKASGPGGGSAALKFVDLDTREGIKQLRAVYYVKQLQHANLMPIVGVWVFSNEGDELDEDTVALLCSGKIEVTALASGSRPALMIIIMPLAEDTLSGELERYRSAGHAGIPQLELLDQLEQAAAGIDFINGAQHDLGRGPVTVHHGNIKPQNILMVTGTAVVGDYGWASAVDGDEEGTATQLAGLPIYASPESIESNRLSDRSDQYSLAIAYIELRTGKLPFDDKKISNLIRAHTQGKLNLNALEKSERDVIRKATAVDPKDRYATALDMIRALRKASNCYAAQESHAATVMHPGLVHIGKGAGDVRATDAFPSNSFPHDSDFRETHVPGPNDIVSPHVPTESDRRSVLETSRVDREGRQSSPAPSPEEYFYETARPYQPIEPAKPRRRKRLLAAAGALTALVLLLGFMLWNGLREKFDNGGADRTVVEVTPVEESSSGTTDRTSSPVTEAVSPTVERTAAEVAPPGVTSKTSTVATPVTTSPVTVAPQPTVSKTTAAKPEPARLEPPRKVTASLRNRPVGKLSPPTANTIGMKLQLIPAGSFVMGSPTTESDRGEIETEHDVTLTKSFYLGVYEVTQGEYEQVSLSNPSYLRPDLQNANDVSRFPVEQVSWHNAVDFCNRLSKLEKLAEYYRIEAGNVTIVGGDGYRLPTEAEWEYACRAGTSTAYHFGKVPSDKSANVRLQSSSSGTMVVGSFSPNAFGLYDMHGNVWEWCQDHFDERFYDRCDERDPVNLQGDQLRVNRGGSWLNAAEYARSAHRFYSDANEHKIHLGFRVARTASAK